jgi:integrase
MPELGRRGVYSIDPCRGDLRGGVAITVWVRGGARERPWRAQRSPAPYFARLGLSLARNLNDRNCMQVVEIVRAEIAADEIRAPAAETELVGLLEEYAGALEAAGRTRQHVYRTRRRILATLGQAYGDRAVAALAWRTLADVNRRELGAYLVRRRNVAAPGRAASADECNHDLRAWRSFAGWAVRQDLLASNPLAGLEQFEVRRDRRRVLDAAEVERLIEACGRATLVRRGRGQGRRPPVPGAPAWLQPAVVILTYTGLRPSELARAAWEGVDLAAGTLTVRRKSGGDWTIPISQPLASYLERTPPELRRGALVPAFPYHEHWTSAGSYFGAVRTAARAAGLDGVTLYLLRHSAATHLAAAGESDRRLMAIFGWKSPAMAARYVHLAARDLRGATDALPYHVLPAERTARAVRASRSGQAGRASATRRAGRASSRSSG